MKIIHKLNGLLVQDTDLDESSMSHHSSWIFAGRADTFFREVDFRATQPSRGVDGQHPLGASRRTAEMDAEHGDAAPFVGAGFHD